MPPAECKAKSYREEGPIFFVTLSTPCTPLLLRPTMASLDAPCWQVSKRDCSCDKNPESGSNGHRVEQSGREALRDEKVRAAPNSGGLLLSLYHIRAVDSTLVHCQMYATLFQFCFSYVPGICLFDVHTYATYFSFVFLYLFISYVV